MPKTKLLLLCALLASACAGGDGDDTNADDTTGGSVDPTTTTDPSMTDPSATTMTTDMTMTTAPTSVTMTTDDPTMDSSSTDADTSTGEPGDLSCDSYCSIYATACADFAEYANEEDCLANCAQWPVGADTDTEGDSLGCRLYHVTVASQTEPDMHCPHAGPSGAGICVEDLAPDCDTYCADFMANCTGDLYTYEDNEDCLEQCGTWYPGTAKDTTGHTVGCHTYHAGAAMAGPEEHCPHAGAGGGGICVL